MIIVRINKPLDTPRLNFLEPTIFTADIWFKNNLKCWAEMMFEELEAWGTYLVEC